MDNSMIIAVTEAQDACKGKKGLKARVLAAMKAVKNHWLLMDEDKRFNAAIAGAILESKEVERIELKKEMVALNALGMVMNGGSLADMSKIDLPKRPLHLIDMWKKLDENKV